MVTSIYVDEKDLPDFKIVQLGDQPIYRIRQAVKNSWLRKWLTGSAVRFEWVKSAPYYNHQSIIDHSSYVNACLQLDTLRRLAITEKLRGDGSFHGGVWVYAGTGGCA